MTSPFPVKRMLHAFATCTTSGPQVRTATLVRHFGTRFDHLLTSTDGILQDLSWWPENVPLQVLHHDLKKRSVLRNVFRISRILNQIKPDVLLTYNWGSLEWAVANMAVGVPHIHFEDGFGCDEMNGQFLRRILFRRLALLGTDRVVVPSSTLYRICSDIWRLDASRVTHIPNGVDCLRFSRRRGQPQGQPIASPPESPGRHDPIVIGTVAELRPEKNLSRLLHVFSRVHDAFPARLIIAGNGPDRGELENLVAKLGLGADVDFLGHVVRPETVLAKLDIYAITSNTEQMPLSVLEAMAHGLPVLGVDVGDVKSMVAPTNRPFIVPPTQEFLVAALIELMKSPEQRARIGAENEWWARFQHDQGIMFRQYEALWREVLATT